VGDAAGYVEPFTGEGIGWALRSAVLASSLLADGVDAWDASLEDRWTKLHDRTIRGHQRHCWWTIRLLRCKTIRNAVLWGLRRAPYLARPVIQRLDHVC
jgi:flavin-dependent dehydrogenase